MKKMMMIAIAACAAAVVTGCQTRITAEKFAEQVLPIQEKVTVNGEERIITTHYQIASGGWYATARSPLYATEALEGLDIGVHTNGSVTMSLNKYSRDLSTNSVVMVDGLMKNGANLVTAIGEAYVKIAGGGAQAETVLTSAQKIYSYFTSKGGDASKATVTTEDGKVKVTDGTTCVSCDKDGNCAECTDCTVTDGTVTGQDGTGNVK